MRLLDLFSGAGGAATGYYRAGFDDITGVDCEPQKHYPFKLVRADALEYVKKHGHEFDAIHASPPCQSYSALRTLGNARHPPVDLVAVTRTALQKTGRPWIIENVIGAPLNSFVILCGTMFGLSIGSADLHRHRVFELSFPVGFLLPPHRHEKPAVGVYGHSGGKTRNHTRYSMNDWRVAMGVDWMTTREMSQAIPPAFCEFLGRHLIAAVEQKNGQGV